MVSVEKKHVGGEEERGDISFGRGRKIFGMGMHFFPSLRACGRSFF
jgi:hypothetical protein